MKHWNVGDMVEWTSQAGGHHTKKVGKVIAVVPAEYPLYRLEALWAAGWIRPYWFAGPRKTESYVIAIGTQRCVMWPRAEYLKEHHV